MYEHSIKCLVYWSCGSVHHRMWGLLKWNRFCISIHMRSIAVYIRLSFNMCISVCVWLVTLSSNLCWWFVRNCFNHCRPYKMEWKKKDRENLGTRKKKRPFFVRFSPIAFVVIETNQFRGKQQNHMSNCHE